ncbi:MAG: threonine synthase [Chloroflexota bacterium]|nr:MAG: threonine synthase [Chloroflexota bacterium]
MLPSADVKRVLGLKCRECGHCQPLEAQYVCEDCFGPLEVEYDYDVIRDLVSPERIARGPATIWRYRDLLPVEGDDVVDIGGGFTPLLRSNNLARKLGLRELWIKNDSVNPSYSFKDRVVSVASTRARELGYKVLSCASTGNLACSVAAHAARAGMRACVFIPAGLEAGKILGAAIYNPTLIAVDGHYDDVNRLCSEIADNYDDWAFVNINIRPYYAEGSKTLAFEVAEQLGWRAPDHVVVPIGSGSLFSKVWKGFNELQQVGLISNGPPRMSAAQASGCAPVVNAWEAGESVVAPVKPSGIAKSLALGNPADGYYVLKLIKQSGGSAAAVTDEEIVAGIKMLAETEGIFTEAAGGVTIAVLKRLVENGTIRPDEATVAYVTGNGLKTQEAVANEVAPPIEIRASFGEFEMAWQARQVIAAR